MRPGAIATAPRGAADRMHGIDALRAVVVLLGVALHAALPFVDPPLAALPWVVPTADPSRILSRFFWWFHAFQIPLFFLLAGFFAAHTLAARGPHGFARHRLRRLVQPLLIGAAVLLPLTFTVFATGWWLHGDCSWQEIRRMKFAPAIQRQLYGPAHLWFLEYLVAYCALFWAWGVARSPRAAGAPTPRRGPWRLLCLALPTALLLFAAPQIYTAHHNSFLPSAAGFAHYGVFFAAGVWLFHHRAALVRGRGGILCLAASLPLFAVVDRFLHRPASAPPSGAAAVLYTAALALCIWLTVLGLTTLAARRTTRPPAAVAYLSAASFWIYLVHLPLLGLWQLLLAPLHAPPLLAFAIAVGGTCAMCLWSYERWVRGGRLGAVLDGHSIARPSTPPTGLAAAAR